MILLLGADGYVGQAFARALRSRKDSFIPLSRNAFDFTRFEFLFDYVRKTQPELVINAEEASDGVVEWWGGGVGRDEGARRQDESELVDGEGLGGGRMEMLQLNVLLPQNVARVCTMMNTAWAHLSSGSIYCGATVAENGTPRVESDLSRAALRRLFAEQPERFRGFTELDEPNCSFKSAPCSFYSGTKALAEEAIREQKDGYIWRLRLPFNQNDGPRNFLTQMATPGQLCNAIHCLSHVDESVNACLELWERRARFGTYNIINAGAITTAEILEMMQKILKPRRRLQLMLQEGRFSAEALAPARAGCILDSAKLGAQGIRLREVHDAVEYSLKHWRPQRAPAISVLA